MKIVLSAAMSRDGHLDDSSPQRLTFSCPEDLQAIQELRASCDAILVGANTIRRDNPSLVTRDDKLRQKRIAVGMQPDPVKVTITASGNIDAAAKFFTDGAGEKLVYHDGIMPMLTDLEKRGIKTLLVEGGANILRQFLTAGLFDECRIATAPMTINDTTAPRLPLDLLEKMTLTIKEETIGATSVTHYRPNEKALMARAVELSFCCPSSEKAFSVGAVIVAPDNTIITTGYSREWEGSWHAEEIAIEKARRAGADLRVAAIYSSMEPCHPRLSGKTSCADRIIAAGITRVVYCLAEPPLFVTCLGREHLSRMGVAVFRDDTLEPRARIANPVI
ncbi:MAG TPA: dihydrofolate reductase family protein [Alphaproteobacteria bacterium]|jgi:5-amino-6-(5-phosphoribosylamino)uracil reductase